MQLCVCMSSQTEVGAFCPFFYLQVLSVTETFVKQLLQVPGVTPEKAAAITDRYSTPSRWVLPAHTTPKPIDHTLKQQMCHWTLLFKP